MIINSLINKFNKFNKKSYTNNIKLDTFCNHCFMYKSKDYKCCKCYEFIKFEENIDNPLCRLNYNKIINQNMENTNVTNKCKNCLFDNNKFMKIQHQKYKNNTFGKTPITTCINIE